VGAYSLTGPFLNTHTHTQALTPHSTDWADWLTAKLLPALASIAILSSESHRSQDHILLSDVCGSLQSTSHSRLDCCLVLAIEQWHTPNRKHRLQQSLYCCMFILWGGNLFTAPFYRNGRLFVFYYSGFQSSCHNVKIDFVPRERERGLGARVEAGSNTSTVALRVVEGDEKGTQCLGV
jgi:hypothetical protein